MASRWVKPALSQWQHTAFGQLQNTTDSFSSLGQYHGCQNLIKNDVTVSI